MKRKRLEMIVIACTAVFIIAAVLFMFGGHSSGGDDISYRKSDSAKMPEATGSTEEIRNGNVVEQGFVCSSNTISKVGVVFIKDYDAGDVEVTIELLQGDKTLAKNTYAVSDIAEQHRTYVIPPETLTGTRNKKYILKIYTVEDADTGVRILTSDQAGGSFRYARKTYSGSICFSVTE